jgi:hypothetical protein
VSGPRRGPGPAAALAFTVLAFLPSPRASAGPPVSPSPHGIECRIDGIDGVPARGGYLTVNGWAVDHAHGAPVAKVGLVIDNSGFLELDRGRPRPDVMQALGRADFLLSSFGGAVPLGSIGPGPHLIEIFAFTPEGKKVGCGTQTIVVRDAPQPPEPPAWRIGLGHGTRVLAALLALALAGWPLSAWTARGRRFLTAPLLGFALLAVSSEVGALLGIRPLPSFVAAAGALWVLHGARRVFPHRRAIPGDTLFAGAAVLLFVAAGSVPMSVHGPGVVMGAIDDAVRECMKADTILVPPRSGEGYSTLLPHLMGLKHVRPGGSFLLAAMAQPEGLRTHEVHSAAMLLAGALSVLGTAVLARRFLPGAAAARRAALALVATSSVLYTTLYNQHLGNLTAVPILLLYAVGLCDALGTKSRPPLVVPSLAFAALFTFYPELLPLAGLMAAAAVLLLPARGARGRMLLRAVLVVVLAAAANVPGAVRAIRGLGPLRADAASTTAANRLVLGDTTYFPSLAILTGAEPYRLDAAAPMLPARRAAVAGVSLAVGLAALAGWVAASNRLRRTVAFLLIPPAVALSVNMAMSFPYGFSKILPVAVPLWTVSFLLLWRSAARRAEELVPAKAVKTASAAGLGILIFLSVLASRHALARAAFLVPAFDPAYVQLPALLSALPAGTLPRVDQPLVANREWIRYMLRDVAVDAPATPVPAKGRLRVDLLDRRTLVAEPPGVLARTPHFLAVPVQAGM